MALTTAEFMKKWTGQDMPNPKRLPWFDEMKADLEEMLEAVRDKAWDGLTMGGED